MVHFRAGRIRVDEMARLQEPDGVKDRIKMSKGAVMNSGEPMYSQKECGIKSIDDKIQQGIIHRQSDYSIVSKKPCNGGGEKGVTGMQGGLRDTTAIRSDGERLSTKLKLLTTRAKENPKYKFNSVANMIMNKDFLRESFRRLKRDKSPGIDRVYHSIYMTSPC